jgi:hypothetical protein
MSGEPCPKVFKAKAPRKGLNRESAKRRRENAERRKLRREVLARGCQVCPVLVAYVDGWERCNGIAHDWHEVLTRARGGSITDPTNALAACRRSHDYVTTHPALAAELGLVKHSWDPA